MLSVPFLLDGFDNDRLQRFRKHELFELCDQRQIEVPKRATNQRLVDKLLFWKNWAEAIVKQDPKKSVNGVPFDLSGCGRSLLEGFKKEKLLELCRTRDIVVPKSPTCNRLVDELVYWRFCIKDVFKTKTLSQASSVEAASSSRNSSRANYSAAKSSRRPKTNSSRPTTTHKTPLFETVTPKQFRKRTAKLDPSAVHDDSHVCHIISRANGGANAIENFIMLNGALNGHLGNRGDHVMVYLVGLHKALAAVAASRELRDYKGPSARELYYDGEASFLASFGTPLRRKEWPDRLLEAQNTENTPN